MVQFRGMHTYIRIGIVAVSCLCWVGAWAGGGPVRAVRKMAMRTNLSPKISGVRALIKQSHVVPLTDAVLIRKTLAAARQTFPSTDILQRTRHSVVQISLPRHATVLGTGFVLQAKKRLWIAMPYHLGGAAGGKRVVRMLKRDGSILEQEVTIALNGTAGWHSPDISLAELPKSWEAEVDPLEIAPATQTQKVYSVGYVAGDLKMEDVLPVSSQLIYVDRDNMLRQFHIPGATQGNPISGNGYCGSPLLQKIDGQWKVVGMHNGHRMNLKDPAESIGSSVNLYAVVSSLIDNHATPIAMDHGLVFRGWEMTRLNIGERVDHIIIERAADPKQMIVRYLRNFTGPYSDAHVEWALEDVDLQSGDKLIFYIKGRNDTKTRVDRQVVFVIP